MKLDYIGDGEREIALLRIFGSAKESWIALSLLLEKLISGQMSEVALHKQSDVIDEHTCGLTIRVADIDRGIVPPSTPLQFELRLTKESLTTARELIDSLATSNDAGYQWLCGEEARFGLPTSHIGLLISTDKSGRW